MKKLKLNDFKSNQINLSDIKEFKGGRMSCHELADQLDVMWGMGGKEAAQADAIMYMIADGYDLCD